jgi:hypothetical protein
MLNSDKPHLKAIVEKEGYEHDELLSASSVKVYVAEEAMMKIDGGQRKTKCHTLVPAVIDSNYGIEAKSFDSTIDAMNRIQEEITWGGQ